MEKEPNYKRRYKKLVSTLKAVRELEDVDYVMCGGKENKARTQLMNTLMSYYLCIEKTDGKCQVCEVLD